MSDLSVLFDLDGTLTDSRAGITGSIRHAMTRMGRDCPDAEALAVYIGPPLRGTFATLLGTTDPTIIETALGHYRTRYDDVGLFENAVYEGVPEMLEAAARLAGTLLVVTAKPRHAATRILSHFGLRAALPRHLRRRAGRPLRPQGGSDRPFDRARSDPRAERGDGRRPPPRHGGGASASHPRDRCAVGLRRPARAHRCGRGPPVREPPCARRVPGAPRRLRTTPRPIDTVGSAPYHTGHSFWLLVIGAIFSAFVLFLPEGIWGTLTGGIHGRQSA